MAFAIVVLLGLNLAGLLDGTRTRLSTTRVTGADPVAAAASVARESHGGGAVTVIIAGTDALADGVVATGLAGALDAPILLSERDALSPQTRDVIRELDTEQAVLIGGTTALADQVATSLSEDLDVEVRRIAGTSRFDTAGLVADEFARHADPAELDGLPTALVVPAEDVPAALQAGSLAATGGSPLPVLLSQGGVLPDPTVRAIERLGVRQLLVVGPLTGFDGRTVAIRGPAGAADAAITLRSFRPPRVVVVPAEDEARTLIAGPLAGREAGVILTDLTARSWLRQACGTVSELYVIAEADEIDDAEVAALERAAINCD